MSDVRCLKIQKNTRCWMLGNTAERSMFDASGYFCAARLKFVRKSSIQKRIRIPLTSNI